MFPTYHRHSYRGKKRFRRKGTTVGAAKLGIKLKVARRKSMTYLDKLGDWIEKAQGLRFGWKTGSPHHATLKERIIEGKKGEFSVIGGPGGRSYFGRKSGKGRSSDGGKKWYYAGSPSKRRGRNAGRGLYRRLGFSTKSLVEKAETNGFHAKPGRKVKARKFIVRGLFKKKRGAETYTPVGSTNN